MNHQNTLHKGDGYKTISWPGCHTSSIVCFSDGGAPVPALQAVRGLRPHGRPQSSLETSCGARMRTDVILLTYHHANHPGDGRLPRAVMQPVWLRLGLGGAVMTS